MIVWLYTFVLRRARLVDLGGRLRERMRLALTQGDWPTFLILAGTVSGEAAARLGGRV